MTQTTSSILVELMSHADAGSTDQWIHVLPAGTFNGVDGRGPYELRDANAVIKASRERAGRVKMPIDYNHAIDRAEPKGLESPAAGWIDALQSRADGIWGRVEWTPRAAGKLAHREYRYLSPVFQHAKDGTISAILRASLTNTPNLDQLTALASMETSKMDKLPELRAALGLGAGASIDDILARIGELSTAQHSVAAPDPAKFVPIGDFERVVARVHELDQGISQQAATVHVTDKISRGHLLPFLKDWGIALCSSNKAAFDDFVKKTNGPLQRLLTPIEWPSPGSSSNTRHDLSQTEIAIASNLGVTAEDFLKTKTARGAQE